MRVENCMPTDKNTLIPFSERPTCSVNEAEQASDLSRSMLYELMKEGKIDWVKVGTRRLIKVPSLLKLLGMA
jgi:predicted DNA-binding transcriptional regulator AlpA